MMETIGFGSMVRPINNGPINDTRSSINYDQSMAGQSMVCVFVVTRRGKDQPSKVANPACGQLDRENIYYALSPVAPDNVVSRERCACPVPRQPVYSPFATHEVNSINQ